MFAASKTWGGAIILRVDCAHLCNAERLSPLFPAMQDSSYIAIADLSAVDTLLSMASEFVT